MLSQNEIEVRKRSVEMALGQQRLEGLEPDSETLKNLERFASGEIELADVLKMLQEQSSNGKTHR